jgi:flagellar basal-body rod protein FlgC
MVAQRTRQAAIAANYANKDVILDAGGNPEPYRARHVMFAAGDPNSTSPTGRSLGVHVSEIAIDDSPVSYRWDPGHPLAIKEGPMRDYVPQPNVNPVVEQINMLEASRAYEANVAAAEATKSMVAQSLRMLA